jgi:ribosomal protein L11 methyltransferase
LTGVFRLAFTATADIAERAGEALEAGTPTPLAVARFAAAGGWTVEALYGEAPTRDGIARLLRAIPGAPPEFDLAPLPQRDWVAESLAGLAPVRAGRFLIHGRHDRAAASGAAIPIEIEAGIAFGTGHHATTRGCLLAIERIARPAGRPRVLDIGTGTGILAIAAARLWKAPVMAFDIDPAAVAVARANARANAVAPLVEAVRAATPREPAIRRRAPYDLIVANILAEPLKRLAGPVAKIASQRSKIILSGLLEDQSEAVAAVWRTHEFARVARIVLDGWATLILARRGARVCA